MITRRIGNFFVLLGGLLIFLFVFSDLAKTPKYNLLVLGGLGVLVGLAMAWANQHPPPQPSGRFRLFRGGGIKPAPGGPPKPAGGPPPKPAGGGPGSAKPGGPPPKQGGGPPGKPGGGGGPPKPGGGKPPPGKK